MKALLALLTLLALSTMTPAAQAQEGGRDPFLLRTPGVTTTVQPSPRPARRAPVRRVRPASRPAR